MSDIAQLMKQEDILAVVASSMSTALVSSDTGKLIPHVGCKKSSEKLFRSIQLSPSLDPNQCFCTVPSFSLTKRGPTSAKSTKAALEHEAAANLAEPIKVCRNDFYLLPSMVVRNISESFMSLVDSRFRSYLAAFSYQSRKDPKAFSPLIKMFSTMSTQPVLISTIVNTFRVVELSTKGIGENKVVSVLIQDTLIDLDILGEPLTVMVAGNGVIHGSFDSLFDPENPLSRATILINTNSYLQSMILQVRYAVKLAKDKISQMYLLSLPPSSVTVFEATMNQTQANDGETQFLPLANYELSSEFRPSQPLSQELNVCSANLMPPPRRRVSMNAVPNGRSDHGDSDTDKLGVEGTNGNIDVNARNSGLDLLTRAASEGASGRYSTI